jgi:pyochelin synthetase
VNITELLTAYERDGVHLWAEDGQLRFRAPKGYFTEERRAELRAHKAAVLEQLTRAEHKPALRPDLVGRYEPFPLTDIQTAYLIGRADAYAYGGVACHAYVELNFPELDPARVRAVWQSLVARHDMLVAVVDPDGYQQVLPEVPDLRIDVTDARTETEADGALNAVRERLSYRSGPASRWPLFTLHITRLPGRDVLHMSFDMLTVDHASLRLLIAEFRALYENPAAGLPPIGVSFRDYVLARRALTETRQYARDREYWAERLPELPPGPELPTAEGWAAPAGTGSAPRAQTPTAVRFRRLERVLSADASGQLASRSRQFGLTVTTALLTAYAETVGRWSRVPRFTLNVPTVDRLPLHDDIHRVVGDFTSLELLTVDLTEEASFAERARVIGARLLEDLEHPLFTGSEVLADLSHRAGAPVLMPVVFTSALGATRSSPGTPEQVGYAVTQTPQVWIDCQVMERGDGLVLSWDVREGVLPEGLAEDMFGAWASLVDRLAASDGTWRAAADVRLPVAQAERRARVNATARPLPEGLLHEPVIARARQNPDAIAVETGDRVLTYRQLSARAAEVAARLTAGGLRPAEPVAIWMDKGWEQVVAVLGTLLAGGAYLPVETAQPPARRDAILSDARVRTLLTQSWLDTGDLPDAVTALTVDDLAEGVAPAAVPPRKASPDDLAYVIYTSGSTGTPKGVMISHRAALNTIEDINRRHGITREDRVLGIAGLGFDLSVWDLFGTLSAGGTLVLPQAERRGDPSHWAELIRESGITVWNSVPGQLQMLCDWLGSGSPDEESRLRLALLSGDWIPVTLPDQARAILPGLRIVALGGATEGSIWSIAHPVGTVDTSKPSIPYGRPLANQSFHVLDHAMRPCPDWAPGELYIGGAGVALGYLNDDDRTGERFVTEPGTGERVYRTGDIGRYLPDGSIEFLGREDAQVKIRGYRVELAEIEAAIQTHPAVAAAAVIVDDSAPAGRRLAAFVENGHRDHDESGSRRAAGVQQAAARAVDEASAAIDGTRLRAFLAELDEFALSVMTQVLESTGLFTGEAPCTLDEVCAALRSTPRHRHIIRRWLRALAARNRLTCDADVGRYRALRPVAADEPERAWRRAADLERQVGWSTELLGVMRTCADRLPELISGEIGVRGLLFPGADVSAADAAYRDNLAIRHLNQAVVAALREIAAAHVGEERLRVLEVGGGVGGTAGELVPALAEYGVDYLFTDSSPFFLTEARQRFADHPWVRYERFDLDQDIRDQGLTPNSFDVVLCANTLHAAADADVALDRLRELLVPGGHLVFVENTRDDHPPLLISMEFLEVADREWTDLRAASGQSFLTRPQWLDLLDRHGAADVASLPAPDDPLAVTGQELFLARMKTDRVAVSPGELIRHAATRLPEYMLPAILQVLDTLPRTANGKTDRNRLASWLPRETASAGPAADDRPLDELETRLADLWAELMSLERIGREDDFFALGGDSLLVARMVGRLRERIPEAAELEWEVVLRHMLRRPTVAGLAAFLRGLTGTQAAGAQTEAEAVSPLVPLHGSGSPDEPTTVLVHAGTGTIMPYRALITEIRRRSPGAGTVVGLEVPGLDRFLGAAPDGLIEQLAVDYARALTVGGSRRFHVIGYCLGGLIATEVARNLAESGAQVESLTVISSHSPRFRLDDELLAEYSFAVMMGVAPADLGFPADENRVAGAADAVLAASPGVLPDGGLAALVGEYADVARCFRELSRVPRTARIARMCEAVPASAGTYTPEHMTRLFLAFRQSVFAITRYQAEPYAGDITFLRHSGAYPFPGSRDAVTEYWSELTLGDLRILDIAGDHFSCLSVEHSPAVLKVLDELTNGAVTR